MKRKGSRRRLWQLWAANATVVAQLGCTDKSLDDSNQPGVGAEIEHGAGGSVWRGHPHLIHPAQQACGGADGG